MKELTNSQVANIMFALETVAKDSDTLSQNTKDELMDLMEEIAESRAWIKPLDLVLIAASNAPAFGYAQPRPATATAGHN